MTTSNTDGPAIGDVYTRLHKLPLQSQKSVLTAHSGSDGARILRLEMPNLTKEEHLKLAREHLMQSLVCQRQYGEALNEAAMSLWGRPWAVTDYRVSAVGREEFSDEQKSKLRGLSEKIWQHGDIGRAHARASGLRSAGLVALLSECEIEDVALNADMQSQGSSPRPRG